MFELLLRSHSGLRWIVLVLLSATVVKSASSLMGDRHYGPLDDRLSLFSMILAHIQLLLGLSLYSLSPSVKAAMELGMGETMRDSMLRFWAVEHIFGMVVGIALITIGWRMAKKATEDRVKFKKTLVYFSIGTLIIIGTIPWPFREFLGRGWF